MLISISIKISIYYVAKNVYLNDIYCCYIHKMKATASRPVTLHVSKRFITTHSYKTSAVKNVWHLPQTGKFVSRGRDLGCAKYFTLCAWVRKIKKCITCATFLAEACIKLKKCVIFRRARKIVRSQIHAHGAPSCMHVTNLCMPKI